MMWECRIHGGAEVSPTRPTHDCLLRANHPDRIARLRACDWMRRAELYFTCADCGADLREPAPAECNCPWSHDG